MKIILNQATFKKAVKDLKTSIKLSTAAEKQVLKTVKLVATEDGLKMTVANADIEIVKNLPASSDLTIKEAGTLVISLNDLNKYLTKLPAEEVVITDQDNKDDSKAAVKLDKTTVNLTSVNPEAYPKLFADQEEAEDAEPITPLLTFEPKNLLKGVDTLIKNVSTQENRPMLNAVALQYDRNVKGLAMIATDSHRLGRHTLEGFQAAEGIDPNYININFVLAPLYKAKKLLNSSDPIELAAGTGFVRLKQNDNALYIRSVSGNYPDTARLIPERSDLKLMANRQELKKALEAMKVFNVGNRNNVTKLDINDSVSLSSEDRDLNNDINSKLEDYSIISSGGGPIDFEASFNPDYLLDAINTFEDTDLVIGFRSPLQPFVITAVDNDKNLQLVTPVRVF